MSFWNSFKAGFLGETTARQLVPADRMLPASMRARTQAPNSEWRRAVGVAGNDASEVLVNVAPTSRPDLALIMVGPEDVPLELSWADVARVAWGPERSSQSIGFGFTGILAAGLADIAMEATSAWRMDVAFPGGDFISFCFDRPISTLKKQVVARRYGITA